MKLYFLPFFMALGVVLNSNTMEQPNPESYFDFLPDETLLDIFSNIVPLCVDQKEAATTFLNAQSVEKRWFSLINSDTGTRVFNKQILNKFDESLDLYILLNSSHANRQTLQFSKTVFYYAALHHNELVQSFKDDELPWMQFPDKAYCTVLAKNCLFGLQQKEDSTFSRKVNADFNTFKAAQQPKSVVSNYPSTWDPSYISAQLLYLSDNSKTVIKRALQNKQLSKRLHDYIKKTGNVNDMLAQSFVWQPTYLTIPQDFQENKDLIQDKYLKFSKKLYNFS